MPDGEANIHTQIDISKVCCIPALQWASKEEAEKLDPDEIIPKLADEVRERAGLGVMGI